MENIVEAGFLSKEKQEIRQERNKILDHTIDMAEHALELEQEKNGDSELAARIQARIDILNKLKQDKHYEDQYNDDDSASDGAPADDSNKKGNDDNNSGDSDTNGADSDSNTNTDGVDSTNSVDADSKNSKDNKANADSAEAAGNDVDNKNADKKQGNQGSDKVSNTDGNSADSDTLTADSADKEGAKKANSADKDNTENTNGTDSTDKSDNTASNSQSSHSANSSSKNNSDNGKNKNINNILSQDTANSASDIQNKSGNDQDTSGSEQDSSADSDADATNNQKQDKNNKSKSSKNNDDIDLDGDNSNNSNNSQDEVIDDIFGLSNGNQSNASGAGGNGNMPKVKDPTAAQVAKMLNSLDVESKRGAIDGLKSLLTDHGIKLESLQEKYNIDLDELEDIPDEDFNNEIDTTLELINDILKSKPIKKSSTEIKQIQSQLLDPASVQELSIEDKLQIGKEKQAKKKKMGELNKYDPTTLPGMEAFKVDFQRAIAEQIRRAKLTKDTYSRLNKRYANTGLLVRGQRSYEAPKIDKPVIDIYMDVSSSWSAYTKKGEEVLGMLRIFEEQGDIDANLWYFANSIGKSPNGLGGSTGAWPLILENIVKTGANNVVLITDDDMDRQGSPNAMQSKKLTVDGCVWLIWKERPAPGIASKLAGRMNGTELNKQYNLLKP